MFAARRQPEQTSRPNIPKRKPRGKDDGSPILQLERVLGLTANKPTSLALNPHLESDTVAYPAGGVVVLYNHRRNRQVGFLHHTPEAEKGASTRRVGQSGAKLVACLTYSPDGEILAVGEAGHNPKVILWKGPTVVAELVGHKYGIAALAFSPDSRFLVSVGYQHDGAVYLWNWRTGQRLGFNRITTKVHSVAFDPQGEFFVTAGVRHMKFWNLDVVKLTQALKTPKLVPMALEGTFVSTPGHKVGAFTDVACVTGPEGLTYTYAVTEEGTLMYFNAEKQMEKWVDMRVAQGRALHVTEKYIACGGTDGIIRLFDSTNLQYITTLPRPHALDVELHTSAPSIASSGWADVVSLQLDPLSQKLACVYSDRSMYIWDITDTKQIGKYRSFLWHSDAIWGVEMAPSSDSTLHLRGSALGLPPHTFTTYSSDGTVRFWNLDLAARNGEAEPTTEDATAVQRYFRENVYSRELMRVLYVDRAGIMKLKASTIEPDVSAPKTGIRSLRITADGKFLAAGDRLGNVRVYELTTFQEVKTLEAHDAEVMAIDFCIERESGSLLMATASRDRLLHVFSGDMDFELIQTLDDHTSSITCVRFADGGTKLISGGADKSLAFRQIDPAAGFQTYHNASGRLSIYDLEIDPDSKYVAAVSQDRRVTVYSVATGKVVRAYKPELDDTGPEGGYNKLSIDPSGLYIVTSALDRAIRIVDFYSGMCVGKVPTGHSELVTDVKFTMDCTRVVSTSSDGCVFVWRVANRLVNQMLARLGRAPPSLAGNTDEGESSSGGTSPLRKTSVGQDSGEGMERETSSSSLAASWYEDSELPAWARSGRSRQSSTTTTTTTTASEAGRFVAPKGRWAQRVGNEGVTLFSELEDDDVCVARPDDTSERRYTFDVHESPNRAIEKITDAPFVARPIIEGDQETVRRAGSEKADLVVVDLESDFMSRITSGPASEDGDGEDGEDPFAARFKAADEPDEPEDAPIYLPKNDADDQAGTGDSHVVHISPALQKGDPSEHEPKMEREPVDEEDEDADSEPVSMTATELHEASLELQDHPAARTLSPPPSSSSSITTTRQSLSARHIAARSNDPVLEHVAEIPLPSTAAPSETGSTVSTPASLRQRKEATAHEVERMRVKLAAMGIVWRNSEGDGLEVDGGGGGGVSEGKVEEASVTPPRGHAESVAGEPPNVPFEGAETNGQDSRPDVVIAPTDAITPEQSDADTSTPVIENPLRTATEAAEHAASRNRSRDRSPHRSRPRSPPRSAADRDVILPMLGGTESSGIPADVHAPTGTSPVPSSPHRDTDDDTPPLTTPDLAFFESIAHRAVRSLAQLAQHPTADPDIASATDIESALRRVQGVIESYLQHVRETGQRQGEGGGELRRVLETYSEVLVGLVRGKLGG
ncbi:WD40-repeat-containing domain protein [Fimicolochytrium jonesii]|uniref:WD40-repeat-containing domain protein n=1 Tax=Fimicolochytrium jonesii TaxID=1396493 RepID=UPI0022FE5E0D|nr:WD40-repeat-containing domain protein [Fimicolochytrium jonesii]KAI8824847.1 WD40-repeat-containing domain protein [Fimicolochytrium jonesii]